MNCDYCGRPIENEDKAVRYTVREGLSDLHRILFDVTTCGQCVLAEPIVKRLSDRLLIERG